VVEHNSAIYNENGMDADEVKNYLIKHGSLYGYPKAEDENMLDPASFLEKPCDILVPAAIER
jgi:glutamate dehydrogenase (NAD(P)+)